MIGKIIKLVLPLIAIAVGVMVTMWLVATKPKAEKVQREDKGALVEVISAEKRTQLVKVTGTGTVSPAQQVQLASEVAGKVIAIHKALEPGGLIKANEVVFRIDPRDYRLAVKQQAAMVDQAASLLEIEKSRKKYAEDEWKLMGDEPPPEGSIALREPQLRSAEVSVNAAKSGLSRARLAVGKTVLKAPFNAYVIDENIDKGQVVPPMSPVATLVGTDKFWVQVALPVDELSWIRIPGVRGVERGDGSVATITLKSGLETIRRRGRIVRLRSDLDPVARMARVVVEIDDPLGLETKHEVVGEGAPNDSGLPLFIGAYVKVEIDGRMVENVVEVPRKAIRDGAYVYVMTKDDKLAIKNVEIVWRTLETVLVSAGLATGDKVIVSPLAAPVDGMKLQGAAQ